MATNKRLIKSNDEGGVAASFNTVTYTGDSVQDRSISGVGFAPDFTWIKSRTSASYNSLFDTVRGAGNKLVSNETLAEYGNSYGGVSVFENDGFALNSIGGTNLGDVNLSGNNYVAWCWKAGGAAVTNTDGTITSQVSANTEAGFSIVSYTGSGANATVGHGLGVEPSMIIVKNRDNGAQLWSVYHASTGAGQVAHLNTTAAFSASGDWQSTTPDSNVYYTNNSPRTNELNKKIIAYCFAEVEGFSNFGSYVGTGASGNTIVTGFEPAFVMLKRTDVTGYPWAMADNKRVDGELLANSSDAERNENTPDFLENGFRLTTERYNDSGSKWIYMAFANQF